MDGIRQYLFSVAAAALICGVCQHLLGSAGSITKIMKFMTGLVLAVVVLAPIKEFDINNYTLYFDEISEDAETSVAIGSSYSKEQLEQSIIQKTQAYVLDKADSLGVEIAVKVKLNQEYPMTPCGITVTGKLSPYTKQVLSEKIEDELGIAKEDQVWN